MNQPPKDVLIVDFDVYMQRLGVGFSLRESHGKMMPLPDWTTAQCLELLRLIREEVIPQGRPVLLKKHPARWIYASILRELQPLGVWIAQYDGSVARLEPPRVGEESPLVCTLTPWKDKLQMTYAMADPEGKDGDFSISFTNLGQVQLPAVPEGQHLLIQTLGSSAVASGMALVYGGEAKSLWLAEPKENLYKCAISNCEACAVGDELRI